MQFDVSLDSKKRKKSLLFFWMLMIIALSFFSGFFIAAEVLGGTRTGYSVSTGTAAGLGYFDSKLYAQVLETVKENYYDKKHIDDHKLFYGALQGMVAAVGDPYTVFFEPKINEQFTEELEGSFDGIGAELGMKKGSLTVIAPLADSPAEKVGLRAGDVIVSIDSRDAGSLTLDEAVSLIRGKAGTIVKLTIYRQDHSTEALTFEIKRSKIVVPTATLKFKDDIAIINLYNFNSESERQFVKAVNEIKTHRVKGIILDLRNNPGGFLDKAVSIASAWLDEGQVVVREMYQDQKQIKDFTSVKQAQLPDVPTIILVNGGSASASEILAGALQDYGKAKLLGAKTYGKGSVQEVKSLPDGSGLKITISQWLTPKGRFINEVGIEPDTIVPMSSEDYVANRDPQLDTAFDELTKGL